MPRHFVDISVYVFGCAFFKCFVLLLCLPKKVRTKKGAFWGVFLGVCLNQYGQYFSIGSIGCYYVFVLRVCLCEERSNLAGGWVIVRIRMARILGFTGCPVCCGSSESVAALRSQ